jgi:tetratricopeptide (TPR) repeat protein
MRFWLSLAILLSFATASQAADLAVTGSVQATWRAPQKVSVAADAVLRAGHFVTVTVSGSVDINQEQRSERHCGFLGLSCKTEYWTEHHFVGPQNVPVAVQIRRVGSSNPVDQAIVGTSPTLLKVPLGSNSDFVAEYELVAILNGAGSGIDPNRSAGAYQVRLEIDAGPRASAYAAWLAAPGTQLDTALGAAALDEALKQGHAQDIGTVLRNFAKTAYPVPGPTTNRPSHEKLVRKAVEIAPGDPANALALADYFRAVGLYALADEQIRKVLSDLEAKTDPRSRRQLGNAYRSLAATTLAKSGGMDSGSAQEAGALLTKAFGAYRDSGRHDLQAAALIDRARVLRGIRSREALGTAAGLFQDAYDLTPLIVKGRTVGTGIAGKDPLGLDWQVGFTITPLGGTALGGQVVDAAAIGDEMMMAWDATKGRLLSKRGGTLQWRSADGGSATEPAPLGRGTIFKTNNAAILAQPAPGEVIYASPTGVLSPLSFGNSSTCPPLPPFPGAPPPPGPLPPPLVPISLGPDGDIVATACGDTMSIYQLAGDSLKLIQQRKLPNAFVSQGMVLEAGPSACGVFMALPPMIQPGAPVTPPSLIKPDGSTVQVKLPAASPPAPPVPPAPGAPPPFMLGPPPLSDAWPIGAAFTGDGKVLVARSGKPVLAFNCSDGSLADTIPLPAIAPGQPIGRMIPLPAIRRLDGSSFAVVELGVRVVLLDWPTKAVRSYPFPPAQMAFQPLPDALLPPAAAGAPPRSIRYQRSITVRRSLTEDATIAASFTLPGGLGPLTLLNGGNYLLAEEPVVGPRLIDLKTATAVDVPVVARRFAFPVDDADGWAVLRFGPPPAPMAPVELGPVEAIEVFKGGTNVVSAAPPPISAAARTRIVEGLKDVWSKLPPAVKGSDPGGPFFPQGKFDKLIANPDRIRFRYTASGSRLMPLSPAPTGAAHVICAMPSGIDDAGNERPFDGFSLPSAGEATLVTYVKGQPVFTTLPPGPNCLNLTVADGQAPTAFFWEPSPPGPNQKFTLKWFRGGKWVVASEGPTPPFSIAAWTTSDGSLLLLMPLGAPGIPSPTFALKRLSPAGGMVDACPACGSLKLMDSLKAVRNTDSDAPNSWDDLALMMAGPLATLRVDPTGQIIAYPDQDETVIRSSSSGSELLRTKLSAPAMLTADTVALGRGDGRLQIYALSKSGNQ